MSLKYVAAYLMAVAAGNERPKNSDVETILSAIGADIDKVILNKLLSEMSGKTTHEVIAAGLSKLQSVSTGPAVSSAASGEAKAATAAPVEEEKEEEPEEEEEDDMGFSLFD